MLINGIKHACNTCIKGHRSSNCNHIERPLVEIRKKGRPVTQCTFCRDLRKTKQVHIKCTCMNKSENTVSSHQKPCCLDCSSLTGGHPLLEMAQGSFLADHNTITSAQCTCHEMNSKLSYNHAIDKDNTQAVLMRIPDGSHIVLPTKTKQVHQKSMLDQQDSSNLRRSKAPKSPRRRRSFPMRNTNISARSEFPYSYVNSLATGTNTMIRIDDASFDINSLSEPAFLTEMQPFSFSNSFLAGEDNEFSTNSAHSVSSASSISSPNIPSHSIQNYAYEDKAFIPSLEDTSLVNLLSHVLDCKDHTASAVDKPMCSYNSANMARSPTSSSSSSLSNYKSSCLQQFQPMCGSLAPHHSCPSLDMQVSGESVMITITPLINSNSCGAVEPLLEKQVSTRILTCYYGTNCVCPECIIHSK